MSTEKTDKADWSTMFVSAFTQHVYKYENKNTKINKACHKTYF